MRHLVIGALILVGSHAWGFNGCPPPTADADKCQMGIIKALSKFGGAVIKCHAKQADGAFKLKPVDDEPCEEVGPKSAKGKLVATIAKAAPKCPAEVVANADAVATSLVSGAESLDVQNGLVYCDSSGAPIDPSGDDAGFIPASKDQLKCADGVGKNIAKLWGSIAKCSNKAADAAFKGKTFDEATCRSTATGKYDEAKTKLLGGDCPACLDASAQDSLRDSLRTQLDAIDGQIFICPGSTTTTSAPTTTTGGATTTTAGATTTTAGATTTTSGATTTTDGATTTTSTASTTTTTAPGLTSCPAGGQVDVVTTMVPDVNTFNSGPVGGMEVDIGYPASVSMPGSGFLPVNDPSDPATLIVFLSMTPGQNNLYDGSQTLFDADTAAPFLLKAALTFNPPLPPNDPGANVVFNQVVPFERARFTCTPGTGISAANFTCTISQEVNALGGNVPPEQRPSCVLTLAAPS